MRRKDREVQSLDEIFDILNRCDTVRVGFRGEEYPYVVPVSRPGTCPVVRGGAARGDWDVLLKPVTRMSFGMERPIFL